MTRPNGPGAPVEALLKYYFPHYIARRKKSKIFFKLIYDEESRDKYFTKSPLGQIRYLSKKYISNTAFRIYGDKVALLLLSEDEPLAIIIKNKSLSEGYSRYFEILWDAATE